MKKNKKWLIVLIIISIIYLMTPTDSDEKSELQPDVKQESLNNDNKASNEQEDSQKDDLKKDQETKNEGQKTEEKSDKKVNEKFTLKINDVYDRSTSQTEAMFVDEGQKIVDVNITLTNNDVADGLSLNPFYFTAETENLTGIDMSMIVDDEKTPKSDAKLKKGSSQEYVLSFSIPEGEQIISVSYDNLFQKVKAKV